MNKSILVLLIVLPVAAVASPAGSQSIQTDDDIETAAQLVSTAPTGTAPLAVSSTTLVPSLNADQVDGLDASAFALDADLQNVEALLTALGTAPVQQTGQTICYDAAGAPTTCGTGVGLRQDGDVQSGVAWPNPRFTMNGDGTVKDNLTGLIWLEDADCFSTETWANALAKSNALFDGCPNCEGTDNDCGLSDGSTAGQWRLPNERELLSLVHFGVFDPAVPNTAGTGKWTAGDPFVEVTTVVEDAYWTSNSDAFGTDFGWIVELIDGKANVRDKTFTALVWPVRNE